jgi:hypothetical protein
MRLGIAVYLRYRDPSPETSHDREMAAHAISERERSVAIHESSVDLEGSPMPAMRTVTIEEGSHENLRSERDLVVEVVVAAAPGSAPCRCGGARRAAEAAGIALIVAAFAGAAALAAAARGAV